MDIDCRSTELTPKPTANLISLYIVL